MVNQNKELFKDKATRNALQSAVDKEKIVKEVFGDNATKSTQIYPAGELPAGKATDDIKFDLSKLTAISGQFAGKTVDLGFTSDDPATVGPPS
jgi:ABC-type oligopeptide transport system substrate-binding subunit